MMNDKMWNYKSNKETKEMKNIMNISDSFEYKCLVEITELLLDKFIPKEVRTNICFKRESNFSFEYYTSGYWDSLYDYFMMSIPSNMTYLRKYLKSASDIQTLFCKFIYNFTDYKNNAFLSCIVFTILHEIGHYYSYINDEKGYGYDIIKNMISKDYTNDIVYNNYLYRTIPGEAYADLYAILNFEKAAKLISSKTHYKIKIRIPKLNRNININIDMIEKIIEEQYEVKNIKEGNNNFSKKRIDKFLSLFEKDDIKTISEILGLLYQASSTIISEKVDIKKYNNLIDSVNEATNTKIEKDLYNFSRAIVCLPEVLNIYYNNKGVKYYD